jgi:hypothetical protein
MAARRTVKILAASAAVLASGVFAGTAVALANAPGHSPAHHHSHHHGKPGGLTVTQVLFGMKLSHTFTPAGSTTSQSEPLTSPDDITILGRNLFVTFQNGVGPQGQASTSGNLDSTIVEFTQRGKEIAQWDLKGKCDGLTADPARHYVIATIDEDANSSIDTITPSAPAADQVTLYNYSDIPLPHNGGTDAIEIYHGQVFVSASAPGTPSAANENPPPAPQPTYPAVYIVKFHKSTHIAQVTPLFYDEASAKVANVGSTEGSTVQLALTDPDSNEVVPSYAPRFRGDFMLTSQGDMEQIFYSKHHGTVDLWVLKLTDSVDDTAWVSNPNGRLFGSDQTSDTVDMVSGGFRRGEILAAETPCDANDAPATCPGPGFGPNTLDFLNPWTGVLTKVNAAGPAYAAQGLVFVAPGGGHRHGHGHRH